MSRFADRARQGREIKSEVPEWYHAFAEAVPEIAAVLFGTPKGPEGEEPVPPQSIILKVYQGKLQFTLSRQGSTDMWSGIVEDPLSLMVSLEAALMAGAYDHVEKKSNGYRPSASK